MTIDEIKTAHPGVDVYELSAPELPEPLFVRKPSRTDLKRRDDEIFQKKAYSIIMQNFMQSCMLHPAWPRCVEIFEQNPAVEEAVQVKLSELAGSAVVLQSKKV